MNIKKISTYSIIVVVFILAIFGFAYYKNYEDLKFESNVSALIKENKEETKKSDSQKNISDIKLIEAKDEKDKNPDQNGIEKNSVDDKTLAEGEKNSLQNQEEAKKNLPEITSEKISVSENFKYANESVVKNGQATLYKVNTPNAKNKTVCVNAGHGSQKSISQYTYCNPAHLPKFIAGSTSKGKLKSPAASYGTVMANGDPEAVATLKVSMVLKDKLLKEGYNVLMIRETDDIDLDNIARTVLANNYANCHIAIHFDGTSSNKGAFCINVPDIPAYKEMEPVKSTWKLDNKFAEDIIDGLRTSGIKIHSDGFLGLDLTQTSYSTVPTTDVELGDKITDYSDESAAKFADGLVKGIDKFFFGN